MASIFDQASLIIDARNAGIAPGKIFPLKPNVKDLTGDFIPFARNGVATFVDANGVLQTAAANVARRLYVNGVLEGFLFEPATVNRVRNNTNVGAVAGAPGTLPTNWQENTRGLTRTVVGTGTLNGVEYIDVRYNGTANATGEVQILFEGTTQIVATNGQSWTNSFWFQVISQPTPPLNYVQWTTERTAAGTAVANGSQAISTPTTWARYSFVRALAGGGTVERVTPEFRAGVTNGLSYDFTIRIGLPQMEQDITATSVIKTSGSTVTRIADVASLTGATSLIGQTEGTLYAEVVSRNYNSGGNGARIVTLSDGTTNNRLSLARQFNFNNRFQGIVSVGGVLEAQVLQGSDVAIGGTTKMTMSYRTNDITYYTNGVQSALDTISSIPACSRLDLGNQLGTEQFINGAIKTFAIFPRRLSDTESQYLTTL